MVAPSFALIAATSPPIAPPETVGIWPFLIDIQPIALGQALQILAVVLGLTVTLWQFRKAVRATRVANLLTITKNHREVWSELLGKPDIAAILDDERLGEPDRPLSRDQRLVVNFLLLHMAASDTATRYGALTRNPNVPADIGALMSRSAFSSAWKVQKRFHLKRFVRVVDRAVAKHEKTTGKTSKKGSTPRSASRNSVAM